MYVTDKIFNEQKRHTEIALESLRMYDELSLIKDSLTVDSYIRSSYATLGTLFTNSAFVQNDFLNARNMAYNAAFSRQFSFIMERFLPQGPMSTTVFGLFPLLSDCQSIIDNMKNWKGFHDHELVKKGSVWYMLRALLAGDEDLAHFHYERTGKHAYKKLVAYHIERRCLKAILDKDAAALKAGICEFLDAKIHKRFLDKHFLGDYFFSAHAMIYIKLAHQFNLKVNVEHELVPQALVPFQPLDNYELLYEFMKRSS